MQRLTSEEAPPKRLTRIFGSTAALPNATLHRLSGDARCIDGTATAVRRPCTTSEREVASLATPWRTTRRASCTSAGYLLVTRQATLAALSQLCSLTNRRHARRAKPPAEPPETITSYDRLPVALRPFTVTDRRASFMRRFRAYFPLSGPARKLQASIRRQI